MGMFDNYDTINKKYQPNNLSSAFPKPNPINDKLSPAQLKKPYEEYNELGQLIGYFWYYGDTLNLEFNLSGEVAIDSNVEIYYVENQAPTRNTIGSLNENEYSHYIYNIKDDKWYECKYMTQIGQENEYIWEEIQEPNIYNEKDLKSIYLDISDILKDKRIKVNIYDFRNKLIMSQEYENPTTQIVFPITQEISQQMTKGTYQCSLVIFNNETQYTNTIFSQYDCVLTVK